ncbi:MAG TPA: M48 family metallopeptidase [Ferruginibacter sp.]|nr:M48 family metallopeptidase [Ferruginibacter sp.]MBN8700967.1 M48 family metallopeptidase [Chitinophagales bacterium]HMW25577.1 M48 family metallopeptidase [Ferruginibacter sp.]HMX80813.1 M48 family metallopeptidase [Ferruginibacter sp.]HNA01051.1 M48 family metallopeptidase [Ferruginibacter sp.]
MKRILSTVIALSLFTACSTNSVTGRKQLKLFPEETLQQQAITEYRSFLSQNKVLSSNVNKDAEMVNRVGNRIAKAITDYYTQKGLASELNGYKWEFNLVESKEVNAWCMPGGKVVVYTGLLGITQNEAALAVVMGHEITHAIAHHGNERISQVALAQGLEIAGNIFTSGNQKANNIFNNVFAPTAQIGVLLPNSRNQEYEADHFGLNFAAMAGYNPREAVPFWQRMAAASGSGKPPEFLSTHPSDENRIAKLQSYMDEALSYYKPVGK